MSAEIQETIDRLRELDRKASPAPWIEATDETNPDAPCLLLDSSGELVAEGEDDWASHWLYVDKMVPLLTELRNAIPALLAEIERLTEENQTLRRENHLAWAKGHAAGWDCHTVTMQAADLLPKDQKPAAPTRRTRNDRA